MYILILITSLNAKFHHQIEIHSIPGLKSEAQCIALGHKIEKDMTQINPSLEIKSIYCEQGYN